MEKQLEELRRLVSGQRKTIRRQMYELSDIQAYYMSLGAGYPPDSIEARAKQVVDLEADNAALKMVNEEGTEVIIALKKDVDLLREALKKSLEMAQKTDYLYREDRKFFYNSLCATIDYMKEALAKTEPKQ
jgi:hypothetical protein